MYLEVKTSTFSLWQWNELPKTFLLCDAAVVSQNRNRVRIYVSPQQLASRSLFLFCCEETWKVLCSRRLLLFCYKVRERVQKTWAMCIRWRCMMACCSRVGRLAMSPAEEVQHELKRCKCFVMDLRDGTFLLKLTESSTVCLLVLYKREIICPRVDCTVFILSCWGGWCAQLTMLWKVEVILGSLHFANSGE